MNERTKYCKRRKAGRLNLVAYVISSRRCVGLASKMQSTSRVPSALLWPVTFHIASPKRASKGEEEREREWTTGGAVTSLFIRNGVRKTRRWQHPLSLYLPSLSRPLRGIPSSRIRHPAIISCFHIVLPRVRFVVTSHVAEPP